MNGARESRRSRGSAGRALLLVALACLVVAARSRSPGREMLYQKIAKIQERRDEMSKALPCITSFIAEYFRRASQISLVLPDAIEDAPEFAVKLLSELHAQSTVYTLTLSNMNRIQTENEWADAILLSDNARSFEKQEICITDYCKRTCRFVIVLTGRFADTTSYLKEAGVLLQWVCMRSLSKLAILALVGDTVFHIGTRLSRQNNTYTGATPILLRECKEDWRLLVNKTTASVSEAPAMVSAAMFENFPYAIMTNETNGTSFDGVEGRMVEQIARHLRFKLNREMIEWTNTTKIELEVNDRLYNSTTNDLVFGGLLLNTTEYVEYLHPYGFMHIVWIFPLKSHVSLAGLIAPFSATVWYAILSVLIAGGILKQLLFRDITFLDIAGLLFSVAVNRQPFGNPSRIKFMSWALFSFFLAQLYLASLADQLINASDTQIETMEELVGTDLILGGTSRFSRLFQRISDESEFRRSIREKFVIFNQREYLKKIQDVIQGRNTSLALVVGLNLTDRHVLSNLGHAQILKETIVKWPLALTTWHGSPYSEDMSYKIQQLFEAGIIDLWSDLVMLIVNNRRLKEQEEQDTEDSNLDLYDIAPAFFLLLIGFLGGFCLLLMEIIFYPSKLLF